MSGGIGYPILLGDQGYSDTAEPVRRANTPCPSQSTFLSTQSRVGQKFHAGFSAVKSSPVGYLKTVLEQTARPDSLTRSLLDRLRAVEAATQQIYPSITSGPWRAARSTAPSERMPTMRTAMATLRLPVAPLEVLWTCFSKLVRSPSSASAPTRDMSRKSPTTISSLTRRMSRVT